MRTGDWSWSGHPTGQRNPQARLLFSFLSKESWFKRIWGKAKWCSWQNVSASFFFFQRIVLWKMSNLAETKASFVTLLFLAKCCQIDVVFSAGRTYRNNTVLPSLLWTGPRFNQLQPIGNRDHLLGVWKCNFVFKDKPRDSSNMGGWKFPSIWKFSTVPIQKKNHFFFYFESRRLGTGDL